MSSFHISMFAVSPCNSHFAFRLDPGPPLVLGLDPGVRLAFALPSPYLRLALTVPSSSAFIVLSSLFAFCLRLRPSSSFCLYSLFAFVLLLSFFTFHVGLALSLAFAFHSLMSSPLSFRLRFSLLHFAFRLGFAPRPLPSPT